MTMEPFTSHSHRVKPLGPMPVLRLERAPILTPEYRGITPRASLERARRRYAAIQLAAMERAAAPTRYAMSEIEFSESRRPGYGWTLASAALILLVVVLAYCASHVRLW